MKIKMNKKKLNTEKIYLIYHKFYYRDNYMINKNNYSVNISSN